MELQIAYSHRILSRHLQLLKVLGSLKNLSFGLDNWLLLTMGILVDANLPSSPSLFIIDSEI